MSGEGADECQTFVVLNCDLSNDYELCGIFFHIYKYKLGFLFNILQNLCPKVLESCRIDVLYCIVLYDSNFHSTTSSSSLHRSFNFNLLQTSDKCDGEKGCIWTVCLGFFFFKDSPCCFGGLTEFHC